MSKTCLHVFCVVAVLCCMAPLSAELPGRLSVSGDRIVDDAGRTVILRGMNVGSKSQRDGHLSWQTPEDYHNLRRWGMTAIRYMIFWGAVEPEPGVYDEEYLRGVDGRIAWARDAGLHVILDMHQDLWGFAVPGGNGMPDWATLDDGQPHKTIGGAWSTAYFVSPKVHRAFDNFWANAPGPDGVGLQDRFALAWRHVAERYRDNPTVAGFDILNEPFIGSEIRRIAVDLWRAFPDIFMDADMPKSAGEFFASLKEEPYPGWFNKAMDEPRRHEHALSVIAPTLHAFERGKMMPMYRRVHAAVREVHPVGIFFLEPCVLANVGTPSAVEPLTDAAGMRDPLQAYMPHFYDITVDTSLAHAPSENRLNVMMRNREAEARRMGMPLLIGEWGAFYGNRDCGDAGRLMGEMLTRSTVGDFYWEYHKGMAGTSYFESLDRPSAVAVGGVPERLSLDRDGASFVMAWTESAGVTAPTLVHLPDAWRGGNVQLEPAGPGHGFEPDSRFPDTVRLVIPPAGNGARRVLTVTR